ncbi:MAG: BamA/TamA family outer membrane protein [Phaeodactylibacter sp.]|nr:BamA/TamA family outer membrane protein [Phaeodactylibacter sp.]
MAIWLYGGMALFRPQRIRRISGLFKYPAWLLFLALMILSATSLPGQAGLRIEPLDTSDAFIERHLKVPENLSDSTAVLDFLNKTVQELHLAAYLEASIDSLVRRDSSFTAYLYLGPAYEWVQLKSDSVPELFLDASGFRERLYRGKPFRFEQLRQLQERLLKYAENHGYPFAQVWMDEIRVGAGRASARLRLDRNQLILVDKLEVEGEVKVSKAYLSNYLGIREGAPYDNGRVLRIRNRVRELPFLKLDADPLVTFIGDQASVRLLLSKKRASRFDFVIGVLPQNASGRAENNRNLLITGTFNGELQNQFGLGERIYVAFEQLRPETQRLDLEFNYPYVLALPFGVDFRLNLYKRDTSFLDLESDLGIQYLFEGGNYIKAFWNNRSSSLLAIDEQRLERQQQLPSTLDVRNASFGLEYALQRLDYRFNPRKGWAAFLRGGAGVKRIERNNRIVELGYGELYDTLTLRSFQYKLSARLEGYLPVFSRSTFKAGFQGGAIISEEPIFFNEQFRIGGNRLLRGFDEESIFATNYGVGTLEYRLLIGQNSYLYAFGDYAYVEDKTSTKHVTDQPYGFGAGITFETAVGLFGVSLAYGKRLDNPIDFSAPKVHFGYVSLFN